MDKATAGQKYKEAVWAVMLDVHQTGEFNERSGGGVKPLELLSAFQEAGGTEEELAEIWRDLNSREFPAKRQAKERVPYLNKLDEVMRQPATEFKGPKDPDLDLIIAYLRKQKARDQKAERSEFADPDVLATDGRAITKPKTFRRM